MTAAWEQDDDWGTLVWLVMVTGLRRAEALAARWHHLDLPAGKLTVRRNYVIVTGKAVEKDTKTHQMRRISLDPATIEVLTEHRERYEQLARQLEFEPRDDAFLFSHRPTRDFPYDPDNVTHRYSKMCVGLGIDSHLHALRHYSATDGRCDGWSSSALGHPNGVLIVGETYLPEASWCADADGARKLWRFYFPFSGTRNSAPSPLSETFSATCSLVGLWSSVGTPGPASILSSSNATPVSSDCPEPRLSPSGLVRRSPMGCLLI